MKLSKYIRCFAVIIVFALLTGCADNGKQTLLQKAEFKDELGVVQEISGRKFEKAFEGLNRLEMFQGDLLFVGHSKMSLVSLKTGEILRETNYEAYDWPQISVCGDKIVVNGWQNGDIKILDANFEVIEEYILEDSYEGVYVNGDATKAYCFQTNKQLNLMDLATGQEEVIATNVNAPMDFFDDVALVFDYLNEQGYATKQGVLDLENTVVKQMPFNNTVSGLTTKGNYWLAAGNDDLDTYYFSTSEANYSLQVSNEENRLHLINGPACFYEEEIDDAGNTTMKLYDQSGKFLSQYEAGNAWIKTEPVWSEEAGGYFFTEETWALLGATRYSLMFWDVDVPIEGENLALNLEYSFGGNIYTDGLQTCYKKAAEIAEKYSVDIKVGEQCVTKYKDEYSIELEIEPFKIHDSLQILDEALSVYPTGFLAQLTYGKPVKIEFSLVGEITSLSENVYGVGAFAVGISDGEANVVANINSNHLESTLYHEIMHLIDGWFQYDEKIKKPRVTQPAQWEKLNPQGFQYLETRSKVQEQTIIDAYANWFISGYSHVNIKEDRAEIMEAAMMGNVDAFKGKPQLIEKLEFLCRVIRENFDTTGWPEQTVWEETLKNSR